MSHLIEYLENSDNDFADVLADMKDYRERYGV
jgi:hypothetical protein